VVKCRHAREGQLEYQTALNLRSLPLRNIPLRITQILAAFEDAFVQVAKCRHAREGQLGYQKGLIPRSIPPRSLRNLCTVPDFRTTKLQLRQ
jgi:hypothetical protein